MTTKELSALPVAKPRFIEPMHISEVRELPDGPEWAYEAKLDGYRCLAGKNGRITLWSRRGTLFSARFPEIARACEKLPPDTVIDGEVVAVLLLGLRREIDGGNPLRGIVQLGLFLLGLVTFITLMAGYFQARKMIIPQTNSQRMDSAGTLRFTAGSIVHERR